jgi:hypothetical protein
MTIWVSVSGGVRTTNSFPVSMDQPEGTLKVAPAEVTRGVSAVTRSLAGFVSDDCGKVAILDPAQIRTTKQAIRAVR